MGELTIGEALKKGVEAHKAGQVQEADRLYTAILKAQPKHPDANHNMGVLAVGVGKVEQALPFLKEALEANPATAQYWLSYIDALIKLDKLAHAYIVLDQAKSMGTQGDGFDKLEQRLKGLSGGLVVEASKVQNPPQDLLKALNHLYTKGQLALVVEHARVLTKQYPHACAVWNLMGASAAQIGQLDQAIFAFKRVLAVNPNNADAYNNMGNALKEQGKLEEAIEAYNKALAIKPDYVEAHYNMGNALVDQGKLEEAIEAYNKALAIKPDYAYAYNNMGSTLVDQGKLEEAIDAYDKALAIKPDNAEAYNNMGNTLKEQGRLEEAIEAYSKALAIKPDNAEAYNNMGSTLKERGRLEEAIEAYNKALAIAPDYADVYNNMGNALKDQGKLEEAIEAYNKALAIKPDYAEAIENSQNLAVQLLPIIANYGYVFNTSEAQANSEIVLKPKYQIQHAIKAYLEADFSHAGSHNNNFKACDQKLLEKLAPEDSVFCSAYSNFIRKLSDANWDEKPDTENKIYHLGESHCLSYAHRNIAIDGSNFRITPRITFGAKAFHFSRTKHDNFKAITKAHFVSLPKKSKIFLSHGEIDCRPNEGLISAAKKLDKSLEELICETIEGYVKWFLNQNTDQRHRLYFINVPAPVYNKKYSAELNSEVARTVAMFNIALEKYSLQHGFDTVDVFKFTVGKEGFSNGRFHVDNYHLGAKALPEIERQLS